jgi:hypothetical protein
MELISAPEYWNMDCAVAKAAAIADSHKVKCRSPTPCVHVKAGRVNSILLIPLEPSALSLECDHANSGCPQKKELGLLFNATAIK